MQPTVRITNSDKCFIWLLMLCGILPFRLDTASCRFVSSTRYYWCSVFLSVLYAVLAPIIYWGVIYTSIHPKTPLNNYMIVMQFVFMYTVVVLTRYEAITNHRRLLQLLNNMFRLREQASRFAKDLLYERRLTTLLWIKMAFFDVGLMVVCAFFFNTRHEYRSLGIAILGYGNLMLITTMNMTTNFVLVVQYRALYIYRQLNKRAGELMCGPPETPNDIVRLYLMHTDTTVTVQSVLEVLSKPMLLLNLWYFFIIVFSIFYAYTTVVQDIRDKGRSGGVLNVINPISFFISEAGQLYYMVSAASMFTERARSIIQFLSPHPDRAENDSNDLAIELITIEYLSRDYTIHINGLYTIDNTMLFSIVASTTSYMIILVQFYLQE